MVVAACVQTMELETKEEPREEVVRVDVDELQRKAREDAAKQVAQMQAESAQAKIDHVSRSRHESVTGARALVATVRRPPPRPPAASANSDTVATTSTRDDDDTHTHGYVNLF